MTTDPPRRASAHPAYTDGLKVAFCAVALVAFLIGFLLGAVAG